MQNIKKDEVKGINDVSNVNKPNLDSSITNNNNYIYNTAPPGQVNNFLNENSYYPKNSFSRLTFEKETLNFDEILEKRIGCGKYQYLTVFFLCLVDFNDGIELLSMSLILPILKREWELESFWLEVISSVFYLGMLIGALITGKVSDKYGRRLTILIASSLQFLITICFCFVNSILTLIILRFIYGFIYGFSLPLSISMVSEIIPVKYRGKLIVLTNFCVSVGKIWGIFLAYLTFNNFNEGNWRFMMALCALTPLLVVIGMYFFVKESPRFLLSIGKYHKAFDVIDHIGYVNYENKNILYLKNQCKNVNFNFNTTYYADRTSVNNLSSINRTTGYFNHNDENGKVFKEENNKNKNSLTFNKYQDKKLNIINNSNISQDTSNANNKDNSYAYLNCYKTSLGNLNNRYSYNKNNITFDDDLEKFNNFQNQELSETLDNNNKKKTDENEESRYADPNCLVTKTKSDYEDYCKNLFTQKNNCIDTENNNFNLERINEENLKNKSLDILDGFNSDYKPISNREKKSLINFYSNSFKKEDTGNFRVLFKENIFPITVRLWICWFSLIFIEFGQYAILPFILISQKNGFGTLLLAIFGEIPAIILSTLIIDSKNFGRKNSLSLFLIALFLFNIVIYISPADYFGALISLERFFMKNSFSMLIPLTSELYPTNFRTIGYGFSTAIGRAAATVCPYLLFPLFYWNALSAFIVFAVLSLCAFIASCTIPYETSGRYLDSLLIDKNDG